MLLFDGTMSVIVGIQGAGVPRNQGAARHRDLPKEMHAHMMRMCPLEMLK